MRAAPRLCVLAVIAAVGIASSVHVSAEEEGAPLRSFHDELVAFEQATGRTSRLTRIAEIETLSLVEASEEDLQLLLLAIERPFQIDVAPLAEFIAAWAPALVLYESCWELEDVSAFRLEGLSSPSIRAMDHVLAVRLLLARAQASVAAGSLAAALDDIATSWMVGASLEDSRQSAFTVIVGLLAQDDSMRHLRELLVMEELAVSDLEDLLAKFTRRRRIGFSAFDLVVAEWHSVTSDPGLAKAVNSTPPASPLLHQDAHSLLRSAAEQCEALPPADLDRIRGTWESAQLAIGMSYAPWAILLGDAPDLHARVLATRTSEHAAITHLVVVLANEQSPSGRATPEEVERRAGPLAACLIDPWTGEPLRIENRGGRSVSIDSPHLSALAAGGER